jgi:hypothetical protein
VRSRIPRAERADCVLAAQPPAEGVEQKEPEFVSRPYTPVSSDDDLGYFDLVIKVSARAPVHAPALRARADPARATLRRCTRRGRCRSI